ncbi:MAG: M20 family metallopeptidase [Anaerocolumna sp.]
MTKEDLLSWINKKSDSIFILSDSLWDHPELNYQEHFAKEQICNALEKEGFFITSDISGISTAFTGTYGSGSPVIGILGEFDALAGLSQKACVAEKVKDPSMENGHGCGHNLLGAGSLLAAFAVKHYLEENRQSGTIIYYGCPAEEGGSGKTFLARDGVFSHLDAALSWHPSDYNAVSTGSSLANIQILYKFNGISAHAASVPHLGRSALDAVELMNVGSNFLREHIIPEARIHYAITNSGGTMPGIVQPYAEVLYMIRAPRLTEVREIKERLTKVAEGAALMTGTTMDAQFIKSSSNIIPNTALGNLLYLNMKQIPVPAATDEELQYAENLQDSMDETVNSLDFLARHSAPGQREYIKQHFGQKINDFLVPYAPIDTCQSYSTDVGDVSWVCPTAQIATTTWIADSVEHTWQVVAQGKSSLAHSGLLYAAKVLASTIIDLLDNPSVIITAKKELKERLQGESYLSPIPPDVNPSLQKSFNH